MNDLPLVLAVASALAGLALGVGYFRALRHSVDVLTVGGGWLVPAALVLARLGGALILLAGLARLGATALLAGLSGFLLARRIAVHAARRAG